MFSGTYPWLMAEYNAWQNDQVYTACATLADDVRKADRGAFFKSIHATLDHILWGDRIWLTRLSERKYTTGKLGEPLYTDFDELRRAREAHDQELLDWARDITPQWLAEPMTWSSGTYGFTQTQPRWVLCVQMFNHQTHHRGQVHALLTQLGIDPGVTDVPKLPLLKD
jgi:uncharacterized damage-inducible protein DinB